ncbi:MAG TPA: serine hydrolase [candidate division Zixibacteria bacterium]|nr:serine hydrolase [candidate division Zixibacteria bacterium]
MKRNLFKRFGFLIFCLLIYCGNLYSQGYDFSAIDSLLLQNLNSKFAGNVVCLVAQDDTLIYSKSLGVFTPTTVQLIASTTKTFSGALILTLVDEGLINLDDSIGTYLPIFSQYGKGHCTIRQCFSHTGGWPEKIPDNLTDYLGSSTMTLAEAVDSIATYVPLVYTPASFFLYGGVSMHIIGRVAEVVTNTPWDTLFKYRIAQKCDLKKTTFCLTGSNPRIAGGLCSTAEDIMKFASMLLHQGSYNGNMVLSPTAVGEIWTDQTNKVFQLYSPYPNNPPYNNPYTTDTIYYGIGSWLDVYNPELLYQEQISGAGAFGTYFWVDRCRMITGVVFTKSTYLETWPISFQIVDIVRNEIDAKDGDLNGDTQINLTDIIYLVNYIFKGGPAPVPERCKGDVNNDQKINLTDIIYLVNYIFKGGPAPNPPVCCL